jgi:signal transduction histidine kinase
MGLERSDLQQTTVEPLAILAHELRNPIGAIRNAVTMMESVGTLPGAMDQARRLIARQVGQLSVLVEDLLDLASFARGTLVLRRNWIDLVPEVEAAVEACSWSLTASGHSLRVEVPQGPLRAYIDGPRLRQVITNLLDNACKYTRPYGWIRLTLERVGGCAIVSVEDNGIGISIDRLPHVFDLFARSSGRLEDPSRGLGVGLSLVREIVELHGGSVEARSGGVDRGSAFIVRLPLLDSTALLHNT